MELQGADTKAEKADIARLIMERDKQDKDLAVEAEEAGLFFLML